MVALAACGCGVATAAPPAEPAAKPAAAAPAAPVAEAPRLAVDLLDNRVHASSHREGHLVVDAGGLDFLKYVDGGWKTSFILGDKDQGARAALVSGLSAQLWVPLDTDGDGAGGTALSDSVLAFTARALAPKQKVSVFVNEKAVGTLDVDGAKKRYTVNVPAAVLKAGENRLRFTFKAAAAAGTKRSAAAFTDLTFGSAAAGAPPDPVGAKTADATMGGTKRAAISIAGKSSRLSYYLAIPEGAMLSLGHASDVAGAHAVVRIAVDGQPARQLLDAASSSKWADVTLPLGAAGGQAARIDSISRGGSVSWAEPRLMVKAPPQAKAPTEPKFDHIFVWMVDTLRSDKVRAYNPKTRVETPNYDAFAADSTRFAWAQVPGTWSLPSHASLLTGVYPTCTRRPPTRPLSKDVAFIAEDLKKKGFKTAIFSSNGYVSGKWGFERGWDANRNFIRESLPNGAEYLWKTAKPWILRT